MKLLLLSLLCLASLPAQSSRNIVVIAHRGEHIKNPENTLPAFRQAIADGVDYFELDVRTSSDGKLVLLHDGRLDRTTNGTGDLKVLTFEELRALDAGIKKGEAFRGERIPTFREALALAKGHCGIYVDIKQAKAEQLIEEIEAEGMGEHVVFYGGFETLRKIHELRPQWKVMPEASNSKTLEMLVDKLAPKVVAFDARDFTDELISLTKKAGALIYVDRLGPADNPEAWEDAVKRGADGIQTDHPAELAAFLKQRGWRSK